MLCTAESLTAATPNAAVKGSGRKSGHHGKHAHVRNNDDDDGNGNNNDDDDGNHSDDNAEVASEADVDAEAEGEGAVKVKKRGQKKDSEKSTAAKRWVDECSQVTTDAHYSGNANRSAPTQAKGRRKPARNEVEPEATDPEVDAAAKAQDRVGGSISQK